MKYMMLAQYLALDTWSVVMNNISEFQSRLTGSIVREGRRKGSRRKECLPAVSMNIKYALALCLRNSISCLICLERCHMFTKI